MRAVTPWALALVVALGAASTATADEVIYFTNGTTMTIASHRVEKDMIYVDLGSNSRMAFPVSMVDRVETGSGSVVLNAAFHPANQALPGAAGGGSSAPAGPVSYPVSGEGNAPARAAWASAAARSPSFGTAGGMNPGGSATDPAGSPAESVYRQNLARRLAMGILGGGQVTGQDPTNPALPGMPTPKAALIPSSVRPGGGVSQGTGPIRMEPRPGLADPNGPPAASSGDASSGAGGDSTSPPPDSSDGSQGGGGQ